MRERGFTVVELLVTLTFLGIVIAISYHLLIPTPAARLAACCANLDAWATDIEALQWEGQKPPEPYVVLQKVWKGRKPDHVWYLKNNVDANSGHGNDMDLCDEENPGKSGENRDCKPVHWVLFCDHDHAAAGAKFAFRIDGMPVMIASNGLDCPLIQSFTWYDGRVPVYSRWIKDQWNPDGSAK